MAKHKDSKKLNVCKFCGNEIVGAYQRNPKAKVYCGSDCRLEAQTRRKINVACCICGKELVRYKSRLEIRNNFACSLECQRQHALENNRGRPGGEPDWLARSKKARKKWKSAESRRRRLANKWWCSVSKTLSNINLRTTDYDSWKYRILLRLNANKGRVVRRKNNYRCSVSVEDALARLTQERKYFELSDWEKKIGSKLSSHKARRSRKNANRETKKDFEKAHKSFSHSHEDRIQWKQMCFEWLAD